MEPLNNLNNLAAQTLRNAAVEAAWDRALEKLPALALLGETGGSLRRAMAAAVDEALAAGIVDPEELTRAATARFSTLRTPNSVRSQHPPV